MGELRDCVVVPSSPGPLRSIPLSPEERRASDPLDDLLGEDDPRGPSAADAILITAGLGSAGWWFAGGPALAGGVGALAAFLGAILPVRAVWRRIEHGRHDRRVKKLLNGGELLRVEGEVETLVAACERAVTLAGAEGADQRRSVEAACHGALWETAVLLHGSPPTSGNKEVADRVAAVAELVAVLEGRARGIAPTASVARAEAYREVAELGGSSINQIRDLTESLDR